MNRMRDGSTRVSMADILIFSYAVVDAQKINNLGLVKNDKLALF
jgi:hypothetical protein